MAGGRRNRCDRRNSAFDAALGAACPLAWSTADLRIGESVDGNCRLRTYPIRVGSDGRSLILTALDGGARDRKAEEFEAFFAAAGQRVVQLNGGDTVSV